MSGWMLRIGAMGLMVGCKPAPAPDDSGSDTEDSDTQPDDTEDTDSDDPDPTAHIDVTWPTSFEPKSGLALRHFSADFGAWSAAVFFFPDERDCDSILGADLEQVISDLWLEFGSETWEGLSLPYFTVTTLETSTSLTGEYVLTSETETDGYYGSQGGAFWLIVPLDCTVDDCSSEAYWTASSGTAELIEGADVVSGSWNATMQPGWDSDSAAVVSTGSFTVPLCPFKVTDDYDRDGYTPAEGDCDDKADWIHPAAEDPVGDGEDWNCDGHDGVDADRDGYPSVASGGGDCDDNDPGVHPGATEDPTDTIDQNCDGRFGGHYAMETTSAYDGCYDGAFELFFLPSGTTEPWTYPLYIPAKNELPWSGIASLTDVFRGIETTITGSGPSRLITGTGVNLRDPAAWWDCTPDSVTTLDCTLTTGGALTCDGEVVYSDFSQPGCPSVANDPCTVSIEARGVQDTSASTPPVDERDCDFFCTELFDACSGANEVYGGSMSACKTTCPSWRLGDPYDMAGNSFYCRLNHFTFAQWTPAVYCPGSDADGGGTCVD